MKLLNKFGLLEQCIDYACESMQVCKLFSCTNKISLTKIITGLVKDLALHY